LELLIYGRVTIKREVDKIWLGLQAYRPDTVSNHTRLPIPGHIVPINEILWSPGKEKTVSLKNFLVINI